MRRRNFTHKAVADIALNFKTRIEFFNEDVSAYNYALKHCIMDKICEHMVVLRRKNLTQFDVKKEALKYTTRKSFQLGSNSHYLYAIRNGVIDEVCKHMVSGRGWCTHEKASKLALTCKYREEFKRNHKTAHAYAIRHKILDDICSHMTSGYTAGDGDTIYIWRAVDEYWEDNLIYKIGITSARLGTERVRRIANKWGFKYEVIGMFEVGKNKAKSLEKRLHEIGEIPLIGKIEGHTELRALTDKQLSKIVKKLTKKYKLIKPKDTN